MKQVFLIVLILRATICFAVTPHRSSPADALGAHVNYGRVCSACHAPHSPTLRNGFEETPTVSARRPMLWGDEVPKIPPSTDRTDGQKSIQAPDVAGMLTCLTCHDGNYAPAAMIKGTVYEALPEKYGTADSIRTLLDQQPENDIPTLQNHPAGLNATIGCGGASEWDCTEINGVISMTGVHSSRFAANYGVFVRPRTYGKTSVVVCTTCHNPHSMNMTRVTKSTASLLYPVGTYPTRHFLRAPYNIDTATRTSNRSAQFCRQCHADKSNEMNGGTCPTTL